MEPEDDPVELLTVEFVNVRGWLSNGNLALKSDAQLRSTVQSTAWAWLVGRQLRRAGPQSVGLLPGPRKSCGGWCRQFA